MTHSLLATLTASAAAAIAANAPATPPQYTIHDLGIIAPGDSAQGFAVSPGGVAVGRTLGSSNQGFSWTEAGGLLALPNLTSPARPFGAANGANDAGAVVGTGTTTAFGSSPLPLIWQNQVVSQLPLPVGQTLGRANGINASGVAVGSVGGGSTEFGVVYSNGSAEVITTTAQGCFIRTAFGINDAGLVVGQGIDPANAARNVGFVYDLATDTAFEVGALPGLNGALAFAVSNGGHVVGSTMLNQGSGLPFIWTEADGMVAIPLPAGTSQGSARGVNTSGWAVGTASSAFAIPFVYDGSATYRLADLLPGGTGWDLATNTSSAARGISDDGVIVGTGVLNGAVRAFAMIPVVKACVGDLDGDGQVDGADLGILLSQWGGTGSADLDGSGEVDGADLGALLAAWGPCGG